MILSFYRDWGRSQPNFFTHLICLFCLFGFPLNALCDDSLEAVKIDSAAIHNYETLCDFKDTPNFPTSFIYSKGSFGSEGGCSDLEKKHNHPPAVIVTFINNAKVEMKVPIPGLAKVTVIKKSVSVHGVDK